MNYNLLIILLPIICCNHSSLWQSSAERTVGGLCDDGITDELEILNIFNLRDDIVVQTINKMKVINYWVVRNTQYQDVSAPDQIPDNVKNSLFDDLTHDNFN